MWRRYPVEGYHNACWLTGLWSTETKVEGIVPKAARHWGSNRSVVNNPLGEQSLPSAWVSVDGDHILRASSLNGDSKRYE